MVRQFFPFTFEKEIEKAIKFIKVEQFHAGFPEIPRPYYGGEIEVLIVQDEVDKNNFHVKFSFVTMPGRQPIIQEHKVIPYAELHRLATNYDQNKERIDEELEHHTKVQKTSPKRK